MIKNVKKLLIKAYSIRHNLDVNEFIDGYMIFLNNILNDIWQAIEWKKKGKRLIPLIRKDKFFRKEIRNKYIIKWIYSKHYIDSAIKQAYSIINS